MAGKENKPFINKSTYSPQRRSLKEQKQYRLILFGFLVTAAVILGLVGYGIYYERIGKFKSPVASVEGNAIDTNYFIERVRLERNSYIQQMRMIFTQGQFYATDTTLDEYFQNQLGFIQTYLDDVQRFAGDVLDKMIDEQVAVLEAEKRGVTVDDEAVEKAIQQLMFRYYPEGTPVPTSTPTLIPSPTYSPTQAALLKITPAVEESISAVSAEQTPQPTNATAVSGESYLPTSTPYTFDLYKSAYAEYIAGLENLKVTEKSLRTYIRNYLINQEVFKTISAEAPRSEERVWARHILVKTEGEALIVLNRLANGEDWSVIAADVSLDSSNKDNGGDLGWFGKGMMVAEFEKAAFELEVGEISKPVQTSFGWHIIQVVGHDMMQLDDSEYAAAQEIFYKNWLSEIKASLKIVKGTQWKDLAPADPSIPNELRVK